MARIIIVDDEPDALLLLRAALSRAGHEVLPIQRATRLIEEIKANDPDLLILDLLMPGVAGGMAYTAVRAEIGPDLPIIISSGTRAKLRSAADDTKMRYCPKPVEFKTLLSTIDELLQAKTAPDDVDAV